MPIDITMPRLSDTMEAGTIIKWNVKEGDEVSAGDTIADIETDKATMDMQVYDDGRIAKILVEEGQKVDVGTTIAVLAEEGEDVEEAARSAESAAGKKAGSDTKDEADAGEDASRNGSSKDDKQTKNEKADSAATATAESDHGDDDDESAKKAEREKERASKEGEESGESEEALKRTPITHPDGTEKPSGNGRVRISPVAQRLAAEYEIDVSQLHGSGPSGRIIKRDVIEAVDSGVARRGERTAAAPAASRPTTPIPAPDARLEAGKRPMSDMRQTIAKRLVESKTTIPHYQVTVRFNMDPLLALRKTLNEQLAAQKVKLSVNDFLIRACALAILNHPEFNASWQGDSIEIHGDVNVGMAISLPAERGGGLLVGTIRNADRLGLREISRKARDLSEKARSKGLTIEEMSNSTFTISNLGMYGVDHFTAIINPPNSAILAVGAALEQPVARNGQIVIGHEMSATLSLDHRIIDGATAAQYLQTLKQLIENPATLLV